MAWQLRRGKAAESALLSGGLTPESLADALDALQKDICPGSTTGMLHNPHHSTPSCSLLYSVVPKGIAMGILACVHWEPKSSI